MSYGYTAGRRSPGAYRLSRRILTVAPPTEPGGEPVFTPDMHWSLESDGTDATGGGTTLTLMNSPTFGAAKVGNGIILDRASSQYAVNASPPAHAASDLFMYAWVYHGGAGVNRSILEKPSAYRLLLNGSSNLSVLVTPTTYSTGANVPASGWHLVCGGYDSSNDKNWFSIDGAGKTHQGTVNTGPDADNSNSIHIGSNGSSQFLDGTVDEAGVVFGYTPTDEDLSWLYNGGSGRSYAEIIGEA